MASEANVSQTNLQIQMLNLNEADTLRKIDHEYDLDRVTSSQCLLCSKSLTLPAEVDEYLAHLFIAHRLVIADVDDISLIEEYLAHWQRILNEDNITTYCTTMLLDQLPDGTPSSNERYYLLSDIISEDAALRQMLNKKLLEIVIGQHQFELTDKTFKRGCIFCRDVIEPARSDFVHHLYNKHFLLLGKPEKLVFVDHLFDRIERQMEALICLYCEKVFKDRTTLKEHMRKKAHKKINPALKSYDKYFLVNYCKEKLITDKQRKRAKAVERQTSDELDLDAADSDSEWSDWKESAQALKCLFCTEKRLDRKQLESHMMEVHSFDLEELLAKRSFYQRIKIINYIRRQLLNFRCPGCEHKHESEEALQKHLVEGKHFSQLPENEAWNQPEFFFPTFEDDALLYNIQENENPALVDTVQVFCEDSNISINEDAESLSREQFKLF